MCMNVGHIFCVHHTFGYSDYLYFAFFLLLFFFFFYPLFICITCKRICISCFAIQTTASPSIHPSRKRCCLLSILNKVVRTDTWIVLFSRKQFLLWRELHRTYYFVFPSVLTNGYYIFICGASSIRTWANFFFLLSLLLLLFCSRCCLYILCILRVVKY